VLAFTNDSISGFAVTALKKCRVVMSVSAAFNLLADFGISLNSTQLSTDIASVTAANRLAFGTTGGASVADSITASVELNIGDTLRPHGGAVLNGLDRWTVSVHAQAESEHVITPAKSNINNYSARIANNGTATITSQNIPNALTASFVGVGRVSINYSSLGLTIAPSVMVTPESSNYTARVIAITTTYVDIITTRYDGLQQNDNFDITISKQFPDVKNATFLAAIPKRRVAYIEDRKTSGTYGGSASANTVHTRDLNNVSGDASFVTLSANQFTLQAGTYDIDADAPAFTVNNHQIFLYDVTNAVYVKDGTSEHTFAGYYISNRSSLSHTVTISVPTTYEIRHWTLTAVTTNGLGTAADLHISNPQATEVYTKVKIVKPY